MNFQSSRPGHAYHQNLLGLFLQKDIAGSFRHSRNIMLFDWQRNCES